MPTIYPVNEIFESIQGEAYHTGRPSTFIRLQGCDVGCPWCDTRHTWEHDGRNPHTAEQLLEKCLLLRPRHVVLTGGEPCQHDLWELIQTLQDGGFSVQIETSGTFPVKAPSSVWVTLSPKANMNMPLLDQPFERADEIKMPIGKEADVQTLLSLLDKTAKRGALVWLQPLSQNQKATKVCIKAALDYGFRVSAQVHKFIGVE